MSIGRRFLNLILIAVNLIFALLLVLAWIGSKISPVKLLFPAYFTLILPIIIFANVVFVLIWVFKKNWNFIFSLFLLIIFSSMSKSTFPINFLKKDNSEEYDFTIMTYNTYANHMMKKHSIKSPNPVIQYMLEKDPDVLCIQEYSASISDEHLTDQDLKEIFAKYPYQHVYYRVNTSWSYFGNATFSKYPIIHQSRVKYQSAYNSSIISDIDINGQIIRVFNCHLESNKITESDKDMAYRLKDNFDSENIKSTTMHFSKKLGDAYQLRAVQAEILTDSIARSPYPVIVLGDFNDLAASYAYSTIKTKVEDAFVNKGFGLGWTFQTKLLRFRIDHMLYDPSLTLNDFRIDKKVRYSDHFPLIGKFTF